MVFKQFSLFRDWSILFCGSSIVASGKNFMHTRHRYFTQQTDLLIGTGINDARHVKPFCVRKHFCAGSYTVYCLTKHCSIQQKMYHGRESKVHTTRRDASLNVIYIIAELLFPHNSGPSPRCSERDKLHWKLITQVCVLVVRDPPLSLLPFFNKPTRHSRRPLLTQYCHSIL